MTCKKAMEKYFKLDKNKSLPFWLCIHILLCKNCRKSISKMEKLQSLKWASFTSTTESKITGKIMTEINRLDFQNPKKESTGFIFFIITIIFSVLPFVILPNLKIGKTLIKTLGIFFTLPLGILCASIVSIISAIFVIKNTRYFVKHLL